MSSTLRSLIARFGTDLSGFNKDIQNASLALKDGFGNLDLSQTNSALKGLSDSVKLSESEFRAATAGMDDWRQNADGLAARTKYLSDAIQDQGVILDGLKRKLQLTETQYGEDSKEATKLKIAINNQTAEIKKNKAELDKVTTQLDNYGKETDDASSKSLKLGDIFKAGFWSNIASNALSSVVGWVKQLAMAAFDTADELEKMSDVTGLTVEELQELQYVGDDVGVSLDTITGAQAKLTRAMGEAQSGTAKYTEAFDKLGVSYLNADGTLRSATDVMYEAFDALGKVGNETERDALAMDIFGRSAMDLNPLIKIGADGLKALSDEAEASGAKMSGPAVRGLDALGDAADHFKQIAVSSIGEGIANLMRIGPTVAEQVDELTESLEKNTNVMSLIDRYKELSAELKNTGLTSEEVTSKTEELNAVKQQLIEASNGVILAVDLENGKFDEQVSVLEGLETTNREYLKYQLEALALTNTGIAAREKENELLEKQQKIRNNLKDIMSTVAEVQKHIMNEDPDTWGSSWENKLKYNLDLAGDFRNQLLGVNGELVQLGKDSAAGEEAIKQLVANGFITAEEAAVEFGYSLDDITALLGDIAISSGEVTEKEKALKSEFDDISATLDKVTESYNANYEAASKSIDSQITFLKKMDTEAKTSAETLNEALMSQIKYLDNYDKNMDSLLARNIDGIDELAKNFADGSADSAAALAGLAEASDSEIAEIISNMGRVDLGKSQFASTMADLNSDVSDTLDIIQKRIDDAAIEANMYDEMTEAGEMYVQGMIDGINSKMADLDQALNQMSVVGGTNDANITGNGYGYTTGTGNVNTYNYGGSNVNINADRNLQAVYDMLNGTEQTQRQGVR